MSLISRYLNSGWYKRQHTQRNRVHILFRQKRGRLSRTAIILTDTVKQVSHVCLAQNKWGKIKKGQFFKYLEAITP